MTMKNSVNDVSNNSSVFFLFCECNLYVVVFFSVFLFKCFKKKR